MNDLTSLVHATIDYLALHTPWMAEKAGGAVIAQPVHEAWTWIKSKLQTSADGEKVVDQLASSPASAEQIEALGKLLLETLQSDPVFAKELTSLVAKGSDVQIISGDNNKAAKVLNSTDVSISIS